MRRICVPPVPFLLPLLAAFVVLPACSERRSAEPTARSKARAVAARDALVGELSARLAEAMQQGPEAGIAVCAREALPLTRRIADEHGVRMGRTSLRLRNPANAPPGWVEALMSQQPDSDVFIATTEGGARALLPVRLEDRCTLCHGPDHSIPETVRAALDLHYPGDAARGFKPGDLRGYVWVEMD
jgi:hypothetical protein